MTELCAYWAYSRQAYYSSLKRQELKSLEEDIVLELVQEQKRLLPNSGGIKMLYLIQQDLTKMAISIGRDRFFALLGKHDLLVKRKKRTVITTNSNHPFKIYSNLIKDLELTTVYQVLVADITYIRTLEGFMYLALVTDAFSRKILGWSLSDSLELAGCLAALKMALKPISKSFASKQTCFHHSDRGSQYCAYAYTDLLKEYHFKISMAAAGNCYENAKAERINGILKTEFELHQNFISKNLALKTVTNAIELYNNKRPHRRLHLKTPQLVFESTFKEHFV